MEMYNYINRKVSIDITKISIDITNVELSLALQSYSLCVNVVGIYRIAP